MLQQPSRKALPKKVRHRAAANPSASKHSWSLPHLGARQLVCKLLPLRPLGHQRLLPRSQLALALALGVVMLPPQGLDHRVAALPLGLQPQRRRKSGSPRQSWPLKQSGMLAAPQRAAAAAMTLWRRRSAAASQPCHSSCLEPKCPNTTRVPF